MEGLHGLNGAQCQAVRARLGKFGNPGHNHPLWEPGRLQIWLGARRQVGTAFQELIYAQRRPQRTVEIKRRPR